MASLVIAFTAVTAGAFGSSVLSWFGMRWLAVAEPKPLIPSARREADVYESVRTFINDAVEDDVPSEGWGIQDALSFVGATGTVPAAGRRRFASKVAHVIKGRLGYLPTRTEANRMMVGKMVRDYMREVHVREDHVSRHLPLATALVFVPTPHEIDANAMLADRVVMEMDRMGRAPWLVRRAESWCPPWLAWILRIQPNPGLQFVK